MRFLARDRLGDESDGDEEAHLADRQGERPERLVVVVGGCPGEQLLGGAIPERFRGEDGFHKLQHDPFGVGVGDRGARARRWPLV
jgi:hypothetical protein